MHLRAVTQVWACHRITSSPAVSGERTEEGAGPSGVHHSQPLHCASRAVHLGPSRRQAVQSFSSSVCAARLRQLLAAGASRPSVDTQGSSSLLVSSEASSAGRSWPKGAMSEGAGALGRGEREETRPATHLHVSFGTAFLRGCTYRTRRSEVVDTLG